MIEAPIWQNVLSWVLTYLAHSTLLLGVAWLLSRWVGAERLRLRERIWKTALFGGLLTAAVQVGFDVAPLAGRLALGAPAESVLVEAPAAEMTGEVSLEPAVLTALAAPTGSESLAERFSWQRLLLGVWITGGALGVVLLLFAWRRIADFLAGRRRLRRGPAVEILERLSAAAGLRRPPRLCASHRLRSPATVGVFAPQVCIPYRALSELNLEQLEALLAHELAHIVRRDPLWFLACRLIERALFFQPLNRVACRELQEIAEFLADDWAAQRTRRELALARCLTEIATWVLDRRPVVGVVPMASRNSRLAARITRLLDDEREPQDHRRCPLALVSTGAALIVALLSMPGAAAIAPSASDEVSPTLTEPPRHLQPAIDTELTELLGLPGPPAIDTELTELLRLLDQEVEALAREVEELDVELTTYGTGTRQADSFRQLGERLADLRVRRTRLHQLIPALHLARPVDPSKPEPGTRTEPRSSIR